MNRFNELYPTISEVRVFWLKNAGLIGEVAHWIDGCPYLSICIIKPNPLFDHRDDFC